MALATATTHDEWEQTFGEKLRKARRKMKWTQVQMAEAIGISRESYASWESGQAFPRGRDFHGVCVSVHGATGAPLEWLLATHGYLHTARLAPVPASGRRSLSPPKTPLVTVLDGGRV